MGLRTIFLGAASALIIAVPAQAGVYVKGGAAYVMPTESEFSFTEASDSVSGLTAGEIEYDNNFGVFGGLGFEVPILPVRLEGEVYYRRNDTDEVTSDADLATDFETESVAAMVNALADFKFLPNAAIYAGAGVGAAVTSFDAAANAVTGTVEETLANFAYQGMAGVRVSISEDISLFGGYRYFATTDGDFEADLTGIDEIRNYDIDFASHNVEAGLMFWF